MGGPNKGKAAAASSNVRVVARIRPLAKYELENGSKKIVTSLPNLNNATAPGAPPEIPREPEVLEVRPENAEKRWFELDAVLDGTSTQEEAYVKAGAKQAVTEDLFKGFNCTILAYGQTGAGKTFTMGSAAGTSMDIGENDGIIPRACVDLFTQIEKRCDGNAKVELSYLEIYNEEMRDLLRDESEKGKSGKVKELKVRETLNGEVYVAGLSSRPVDSPKVIGDYMEEASTKRAVASTKMNAVSSRSHAICVLRIKGVLEDSSKFEAKLTLVDLAGSERIKKTGAEGGRRKEGININKGLFVLGQVVSALSETRPKYKRKPPYRDSILTRLLQDSLGGNSRTIMVACVSPADFNLDETITTLRYATNARNIKNTATRNVIKTLSPEEAAKLQRENQLLAAQVKELQETIRKMGLATAEDDSTVSTATTVSSEDDSSSGAPGETTMSQQKARIHDLENEVQRLKNGVSSKNGGIITESMAKDAIELPEFKKRIAELEEEVAVKKDLEMENMELQSEIQELKADADSARLAANQMSKIMEQLKELKGDEIDKKRMEFDHIKVEEAWVSFVYQVLETNRQHLKKLHFDFMVVAREVDSPEFGLNHPRGGIIGRFRKRIEMRRSSIRSPNGGSIHGSSHGGSLHGYGDAQQAAVQQQQQQHHSQIQQTPEETKAEEPRPTPPEEDPTNIMKVIVNLKDELKAAHEVIRQQRVQVELAMEDKEKRATDASAGSDKESDQGTTSGSVSVEEYQSLKARYTQLEIDRCWAEFQLRDRITNDALKFHRRIRAVMQKNMSTPCEEDAEAREEEIKAKVDGEIKKRMRAVTENLKCFEERMVQMENHVQAEMASLKEIQNSLRVQQDNMELEIGKTEIEQFMLNEDDTKLLEQLTTLLVGPVKNLGTFPSDDLLERSEQEHDEEAGAVI